MPVSTQTLPKSKAITVQDVIARLNSTVLERRHAYTEMAKKYSCFGVQLEKIKAISLLLAEASGKRDLAAIDTIIRTVPLFMYIAPRTTYKLFNTYYSKLDPLFRACYDFKREVKA